MNCASRKRDKEETKTRFSFSFSNRSVVHFYLREAVLLVDHSINFIIHLSGSENGIFNEEPENRHYWKVRNLNQKLSIHHIWLWFYYLIFVNSMEKFLHVLISLFVFRNDISQVHDA